LVASVVTRVCAQRGVFLSVPAKPVAMMAVAESVDSVDRLRFASMALVLAIAPLIVKAKYVETMAVVRTVEPVWPGRSAREGIVMCLWRRGKAVS